MKYFIVLSLLFFSPFTSHSQINSIGNCDVLSFILKSEAAKKIFFLDKYKGDPLVLVDTNHYFTNCISITNVYERKVTVSDESTLLDKASTSTIIIFGFIEKRNTYKVNFLYKQTGAVGFIKVKKINSHYKIIRSEFGYY